MLRLIPSEFIIHSYSRRWGWRWKRLAERIGCCCKLDLFAMSAWMRRVGCDEVASPRWHVAGSEEHGD